MSTQSDPLRTTAQELRSVIVDFAPGHHGHFLEYVINCYIFNIPYRAQRIFQSSGSCHPLNIDRDYLTHKIANRGHYTSFSVSYGSLAKKIVWIEHDKRYDFVLLTNVFHRCHPDSMKADDFNVEEIKQLHKTFMINSSELSMRKDWFSKLTDFHVFGTDKEPTTDLPLFRWKYSSFFSFVDFLKELRRLADWLELTFVYDKSLASLWDEFIIRNQGYKKMKEADELFRSISLGESVKITPDWQIHAYLNFLMAKIFNLHSSQMHDGEIYPENTLIVHNVIMDHIKNFDKFVENL